MKSGIPTLRLRSRLIIEFLDPELDHHAKVWKQFLEMSDKSLVTKPATERMNIDPFYESVWVSPGEA